MPSHQEEVVKLVEGYLFFLSVLLENEGVSGSFEMGSEPRNNIPWYYHSRIPFPAGRKNSCPQRPIGKPSTSIHRFESKIRDFT
jgi:hypothetical protein